MQACDGACEVRQARGGGGGGRSLWVQPVSLPAGLATPPPALSNDYFNPRARVPAPSFLPITPASITA